MGCCGFSRIFGLIAAIFVSILIGVSAALLFVFTFLPLIMWIAGFMLAFALIMLILLVVGFFSAASSGWDALAKCLACYAGGILTGIIGIIVSALIFIAYGGLPFFILSAISVGFLFFFFSFLWLNLFFFIRCMIYRFCRC